MPNNNSYNSSYSNCITIRGKNHIESELPCQDCSAYYDGNGFSIIAVADGHSSLPHIRSDVGSKSAIHAVIQTIKQLIDTPSFYSQLLERKYEFLHEIGIQIVDKWIELIYSYHKDNQLSAGEIKIVKKYSKTEQDYYVKYYGSTLIMAVMANNYSFVIQIGDGGYSIFNEDGSVEDHPSKDEDEYTKSLCQCDKGVNFKKYLIIGEDKKQPVGYVVYTDGFQKPFNNEDRPKFIGGMISLSQNKAMWYSSVALNIDRYSKQRSGDDASVAITIKKGTNLDQLYQKTFSLRSPGLTFPDEHTIMRKICSNGYYDDKIFNEDSEWSTNKGDYVGHMVNGVPSVFERGGVCYYPKKENYDLTGYFECKKNGELIYKGEVINGVYNGKGTQYMTTGHGVVKYREGKFSNGKLDGHGGIEYFDGVLKKYEGDFKEGRYEGKGKLYFLEESKSWPRYEGSFKNNQIIDGVEKNENGVKIFEGEFVNGNYSDGIQYDSSGFKIYKGTFSNKKRDGKDCEEFYPNTNIRHYRANYENDRIISGIEYDLSGLSIYEGEFNKNHEYHGTGTKYAVIDGKHQKIFTGKFTNGFYKEGKEYCNGILQYEGTYDRGKRYNGTLFNEDGSVKYKGFFENGSPSRDHYRDLRELKLKIQAVSDCYDLFNDSFKKFIKTRYGSDFLDAYEILVSGYGVASLKKSKLSSVEKKMVDKKEEIAKIDNFNDPKKAEMFSDLLLTIRERVIGNSES